MLKLPPFYPILDTAVCERHGIAPVQAAAEILEAGAQILQWRHKSHLTRQAFADLQQIAALAKQAGAMFVINDRADLAKLFDAALHLGQDDLPPTAARSITGNATILGLSTHNEAQLRAAATEPADYLALGPIFGTATKENPDPTVGVEELRRLRSLTDRPLVAIGGITLENANAVLASGADSVAIIGGLFAPGITAPEWVALFR